MTRELDRDILYIDFKDTRKLEIYFNLRDIVNFYFEELIVLRSDYELENNLKERLIIKNLIYGDYFEYYLGNLDLYDLLKDFSDANTKILNKYIDKAKTTAKLLNNFDIYYP